MNQLIKMNAETYAEHWAKESSQFDKQNLYTELANITPQERVIEIGCGSGLGTKHLSSCRKTLVIDNNCRLLKMAKKNNLNNPNITFMNADVFKLSPEHIRLIQEFSPQGIVAWMIGSHPDMVDSQTPTNTVLSERPKLYREAIEDLLVTEPLCTPSVKWIHLANRVAIDVKATDKETFDATKKDYESYMFSKTDFKVSGIKTIDWNQDSNGFMYVTATNPNSKSSNIRSCVISILATR